jgi:hypothetical protein
VPIGTPSTRFGQTHRVRRTTIYDQFFDAYRYVRLASFAKGLCMKLGSEDAICHSRYVSDPDEGKRCVEFSIGMIAANIEEVVMPSACVRDAKAHDSDHIAGRKTMPPRTTSCCQWSMAMLRDRCCTMMFGHVGQSKTSCACIFSHCEHAHRMPVSFDNLGTLKGTLHRETHCC